jgi:hypothetical protein
MSAHQTRSQRRESRRRHVRLGEGRDPEWDEMCRWVIRESRAMVMALQIGGWGSVVPTINVTTIRRK